MGRRLGHRFQIEAEGDLTRVLAMVPWLAAHRGALKTDVAARFGITPKQLERDLSLIMMVGVPPYSPGDYISIEYEGDTIDVWLAPYFNRPLRLTAAEGLAILAHPFYLKAEDETELESIVGDLKKKGLDGIEVHYSTHTPEQKALAERIAQKFELLQSGGSDFHGEDGRSGVRVDMGTGINGMLHVPYEVLEKLKEKRAKRA